MAAPLPERAESPTAAGDETPEGDEAGPPPKLTSPPSEPSARQIPAAIRRVVTSRDKGRCSYVSPRGRRCDAQEFLEFHHLEPWARARTHSIDGIALRCRAHNQYAACQDFGEEHMARFRRRAAPGTAHQE